MAINISTLAPASLKSKNVATEQYVDNSISNIDITTPIANNNDTFAKAQGFDSYNDMSSRYSSLGKTIISGGYINTGLVKADSILANSISADRLIAGTSNATMWTGGGLISSNFNGNAAGNIGSPTTGFRLSSNAVGTVNDPNIYGAYIRGGTINGSVVTGTTFVGDSIRVASAQYPNNTGRVTAFWSERSMTQAQIRYSTMFYGPAYGSGFNEKRICNPGVSSNIRITWSAYTTPGYMNVERSIDGGAWTVIGNNLTVYYETMVDFTLPSNFSTVQYRLKPIAGDRFIYSIDITIYNA